MSDPLHGKHDQIASLCRAHGVKTLELFGSAASGHFDPATSDLDFLVQYEPSSPREHADRYFGLLFALQDLFGREVDLVELTAVRNPFFLQAVASQRMVLYAA